MNVKNLEKLHAAVRSDVEAYTAKLLQVLGSAVRSIAVYGSATGPDYVPKRSNVNLVVVLENLTADAMSGILDIVEAGKRKNIVPPLLVTPAYIKSSLDVFPIEYLEIRDSQVLLYGDDFFSSLEFGRDNLRLECESQLRVAGLRTRQAYLDLGRKKRGAEQVLHASVTSLIPVLRAMLRLKGAAVPARKAEVVEAAGKAFGVDTSILTAVLRDKAGDERLDGKDAHRVLARYVEEVEALVEKLDQL